MLQSSSRDPDAVGCFEPLPDFSTLQVTCEESAIKIEQLRNIFLGGIAKDLNSEVPDSQFDQVGDGFCTALSLAVEQRVSTSNVGVQNMLCANTVPQFYVVTITGATAVGFIRSRRKHGAKDAMLHMKHRHVLMDHHLRPFARN
ncbi:MAG: hypothetical protein MUC96_27200, partial [Myxococcaceae bacterium]|nr:hypothetical protein [Myxococcaceae bacterium]